MGESYHQLREDERVNETVGRMDQVENRPLQPSQQPQPQQSQQPPQQSQQQHYPYSQQRNTLYPPYPPVASQPPQFYGYAYTTQPTPNQHSQPQQNQRPPQIPQQQNYSQQYRTSQTFRENQDNQQQQQEQEQQQEQQQQEERTESTTTSPSPQPISVNHPVRNPWIQPNPIEPILAVLLSLVFPGLGQIVYGQYRKGVSIAVLGFLMSLVVSLLCMFYFGILLVPILFIWHILIMVDAYKMASRVKEGYPVQHGECSNSIVKMGLNHFMKDVPIFNNSEQREWPQDYAEAIHSFENARNAHQRV